MGSTTVKFRTLIKYIWLNCPAREDGGGGEAAKGGGEEERVLSLYLA